ncbi:MAG TPA: sugar ABC transporter substrate-binding protein [Candidatus Humimicrobiaceae bacterium]
MKKTLLWIVMLLVITSLVGLLFIGCKEEAAEEEVAEEEEEVAEEEEEVAEEEEEVAQEFKFGKTMWLLHVFTGEFWWNTIANYLQQHVEESGWTFNFVSADGSDTTQADQIITYAQQADILFVYPTSTTGPNEAVREAEETYHCPVVAYTNYITGKSAGGVLMYDDETAGRQMAEEAVAWIEEQYGTTEGKTVIAINGDLTMSGWKLRQDGFDWIKAEHPEINYIEITGGLTPEGWAEVADTTIAGAGNDVVAILSASDGAYLLGTMQALEKYDKLFYKGDPNHVFIASIDGKPSTIQWVRQGLVDTVYVQVPDVMAAVQWQLAVDYIIKDASYQSEPFTMPEIPLPLELTQPEGTYWGGADITTTLQMYDFSETPIAISPLPRITYENANTWEIYGNSIIPVLGYDLDPIPTFEAQGTPPEWSQGLLDDFAAFVGE